MVLRGLIGVGALAVVAAAQAQVVFSGINAVYNLGSGNINWANAQNQPPGTIDFFNTAPAFKVGSGTGFTMGSSSINFTVNSAVAIQSIQLVLQGNVQDFGRVGYILQANGGALGSVNGQLLGAQRGGTNGAFTLPITLTLTQPATNFTVGQGLDLDIGGQTLPTSSSALVSIVEMNFTPVPEPATMAVLGLGALAVLKRRARKN